ncbi:NUDIX domain-containing protein [Neolewinella lacunae]|uniref:NUDIX hydrolase n=1 Tax=Neolewinella lacunae TaxID=1517758 RepID=A0A923PKG3_9BACT|nr:NUDIX domain-containing protein [Neolewinella lacunae]MBC6995009.1 NUDIX hydrolase [Neolewinella lacunae]MDN3633220.1 NUDIX domain-containing protein [Neolewinella lacunae]
MENAPPNLAADYLPHLAYDCVIFGFSGERLKILILEYHNTGWFALPGGFVGRQESLDDAVKRGLLERTGLDNLHLEQFHTFGSMQRFSPEAMRSILEASGFAPENYPQLLDRFVSVAYYSLLNYHHVSPTPDALADSLQWYPLEELPPLLFDHNEMVSRALAALRNNLDTFLAGVNMLPAQFTIGELQSMHEAILGEPVNRASFQRRMLQSGILQRHEKRYSGGAHKAPYLYSFAAKKDGPQ